MKHRAPSVLYFSLDTAKRKQFWKCVRSHDFDYVEGAIFENATAHNCCRISFRHSVDLITCLNQYEGDLQSLHVIIDIESIPEVEIGDIRDAILSFPEVQFLFDGDCDIFDKLFPDEDGVRDDQDSTFPGERWELAKKKLYVPFIMPFSKLAWNHPSVDPSWEESIAHVFKRIIVGFDNTFDACNMRFVLKLWKNICLNVRNNFSLIQNSRADNVVICVEEEMNQNVFNSYALYRNGYRVLPVTSAEELKEVNEDAANIAGANSIIVIRDYDLQFEDEGKNVDLVRGWKYCTSSDVEYERKINKIEYKEGWNDLRSVNVSGKPNRYWSNLSHYRTYYITKGPNHSAINLSGINDSGIIEAQSDGDINTLAICGLSKPVCGLYFTLHSRIPEIAKRFKETREVNSFVVSRHNHDHSTPLDIYEMINIMLKRAEKYYRDDRYRLASLVSSEAIELLNGFHIRLMVKANYINAISENAIAMDVIGGDEVELANDAFFRINKLKEDIERIYANLSDNYDSKARYRNVLDQIFSDCRQYCKEKEHFEAEEAFISAIGHLNEGIVIGTFKSNLINSLKGYLKRLSRKDAEWFIELVTSLSDQIFNCSDPKKKTHLFKRFRALTNQSFCPILISSCCYIGIKKENYTWRSSNQDVLVVNKLGYVTPIKSGNIVVFAITNNIIYCFPICVKVNEKDK